MKVIVTSDEKTMGKKAAALVAAEMAIKQPFVLGLATGSTPLPLYAELVRLNKAGKVDFSTTITFNLDEYVGLKPTHNQSYRYFMNKNLFNKINIKKENTHVPDGLAKDVEAHCEEYEDMIDKVGGIDLQVLGIGRNGHVGFNEPGSSLASPTRLVKLTKTTIEDNSRFFRRLSDVPTKAITMGMGTILCCKKIVLLATGDGKTNAVAKALEGPITASVPASGLQLHPDVTFIITRDAAKNLVLDHSLA